MPRYEFAIELTVPDNTAFTVLTALRGLGYADLERVERADLLRLQLAEGAMTIEQCALALTRAEVVFNPNKHRLAYARAEETASAEAIVADKDDDATSLSDVLGSRFGVHGLAQLQRATAWRLYELGGPAKPERLEWACRTLLANPHSQTFEVRIRPTFVVVTPNGRP